MGHIRLGDLPSSRKWRQVVELLELGADVEAVAAASAEAAETSIAGASNDPGYLRSVWLLTQIPLAARGPRFADDLLRLGLKVPDQPTLMDIAAAFSRAMDGRALEARGRTDLGEMAQLAAVESLSRIVGRALPSLFEPRSEDVQRVVGRLAGGAQFSHLARDFFAGLTNRVLDYFLSRELASHVGAGKRFADDRERAAFDASLERHCWETSRIVEEFAGGWYGKNVYQGPGLTEESVRGFTHVAFKKIRTELRQRRDAAA